MNAEKKFKLILASLKDPEIIKYFDIFTSNFPEQFSKTIRQISFNCYESMSEFKNKLVSGYGKNSQESYVNSIRTLIDLLADEPKFQGIMKQSLKLMNMGACNNMESQKKLLADGIHRNSVKGMSLHSSIKPNEKRACVKEEIFESLNRKFEDILVDNFKIFNPNSIKPKPKEKYVNLSSNQIEITLTVEDINLKNIELEERLKEAKSENMRLKAQIREFKKQNEFSNQENEQTKSSSQYLLASVNLKPNQTSEALKVATNNYLNITEYSKVLDKPKTRSVTREANQTEKEKTGKGNEKKIAIPKLNLHVLPNYHGKSNKSLNQSLMDIYEKTLIK